MVLSGFYHRCAAGETFDLVALRVYGNEKYAADLLCANPAHGSATVFSGGEQLALPVVNVPENDTPYAPAKAPWKE